MFTLCQVVSFRIVSFSKIKYMPTSNTEFCITSGLCGQINLSHGTCLLCLVLCITFRAEKHSRSACTVCPNMGNFAIAWPCFVFDLAPGEFSVTQEFHFKTHTPSGCEGETRLYSLLAQLDDLNQSNNKNILCQETQKTQQSNEI